MSTPEPGWRASRRKRLEAAAIAAVGYPAINVIGCTWRWQVSGLEHLPSRPITRLSE